MIGRVLVGTGIGLYRTFLRPLYQRECLFRVSCSEHVLRAARVEGLGGAWLAFRQRLRTCRADYSVAVRNGQPWALTRSGDLLPLAELSSAVQSVLDSAVPGVPFKKVDP